MAADLIYAYKLALMTSLSFMKFKIIFTVKRGLKDQFIYLQKNIKSAAIVCSKFSLCSIVMSGKNSHDTASKPFGGGGLSVLRRNLHNFTI